VGFEPTTAPMPATLYQRAAMKRNVLLFKSEAFH
jgi:hypothetical protein